MRIERLLRRTAGLVVMSLMIIPLAAWAWFIPGEACAAEANHAGMVVRFSAAAEDEKTWCVEFAAESISGIEALRLTGLPVVTKNYGSSGEYVCMIGGIGTEASDCPAKDGSYWGYWRTTSQGWRHSGIGASTARVRCGNVEGWVWLQGGTGPAPSPIAFSSICSSASCRQTAAPVEQPAAPAGRSDSRSDQRPPGGESVPAEPFRSSGPNGRPAAAGNDAALTPKVPVGDPKVPVGDPAVSAPDFGGPGVISENTESSPGPIAPDILSEGVSGRSVREEAAPAGKRSSSTAAPYVVFGGLVGLLLAFRFYLAVKSPSSRRRS